MRLTLEQLPSALEKNLAPAYCFSGDEPLQLNQAADAVRSATRQAGFTREIFEIDSRFRWQSLLQIADSPGLFSEPKLLDVRMATTSPGNEGARVLTQLLNTPADDRVILITMAKLTPAAGKAKWYQRMQQCGVTLQVWPLVRGDLLHWVEQRMAQQGLRTDSDGLKTLALRTEGNLLAAAQEIDKLLIVHGEGFIDASAIAEQVAHQSRYDVFALIDSALGADVVQVDQVLSSLKQTAVAEPVVLWALAREIRLLLQLTQLQIQGKSLHAAFQHHRVWQKRQPVLSKALQRLNQRTLQRLLLLCARADRVIKGEVGGDPWQALLEIAIQLTHSQISPAPALHLGR